MQIPLPIKVGHSADPELKSGTTVILPDRPVCAAAHISGGAPGTRETDVLRPENTVDRIDAITLSGGSVFGLAAADGAVAWLAGEGRGFIARRRALPIVPAAIVLDLDNGGDGSRLPGPTHRQAGGRPPENPYHALGYRAAASAVSDFAIGSVGAGTGATSQNLKGGFGAAVSDLPDGGHVAAFVVVNPGGRVTFGDGPHFRAAFCEQDGEFGGLGFPRTVTPDMDAPLVRADAERLASTTLAVVATDVPLDKTQLKRIAIAAHDGLALAVFPVHTPFDGDSVFAMSTGDRTASGSDDVSIFGLKDIGARAATTLARAIALAVYHATPVPGDPMPTWRERFGDVSRT